MAIGLVLLVTRICYGPRRIATRLTGQAFAIAISVARVATRPWWRLTAFVVCFCFSACTAVVAWGFRLVKVIGQLLTAILWVRKVYVFPCLSTLERAVTYGSETSTREIQLQEENRSLQIVNGKLERDVRIAMNERGLVQQLRAALAYETNKGAHRCKVLKMKVRELEDSLQEFYRREKLSNGQNTLGKGICTDLHSRSVKKPVIRSSENDDSLSASLLNPRTLFDVTAFSGSEAQLTTEDYILSATTKRSTWKYRQWRGVACGTSLFSVSMTILVAVIVWHARDPCMPLVLALCTVVGMSCVYVIRYVSRVSHRFGLDAVCLISINSFILGSLTSSFLPYIAPIITRGWWWVLGWTGLKPEIQM